MSAREFGEWMAFYTLEPFGWYRIAVAWVILWLVR